MISTRPQPSIMNVLPISNPELTKKPEPTSYNWKTLTKAGLVFVATTGAFLTLKTTKSFSLVSSWLKNMKMDFSEQETKLAVSKETDGIETYSGHQRSGLEFAGFESYETLQADNPLRLTDFVESSFAAVKDSPTHTTFIPQRAKRNPTQILEKVGPEFQVNTYTTNRQGDPSVAGLSDGKFIVVWESLDQDGSEYGIYGQMFNADGSEYLSEFQVNTYTIKGQDHPSIVGLSNGKFVAMWNSDGQDGSSKGIYGQMYNVDGTEFLSEFQVNTYTTSNQASPSVAELSDGRFVVTWGSFGQDGYSWGVYGQMFNVDSSKYLSEFQVNTYTTSGQLRSSVAGLSDGKFVVTWDSSGQEGSSYGVYGQMYNADGTKYLSEFRVNTYTVNDQKCPSVARLNDGKFVITWGSDGQDGSGYGVYGQMFNANGSKYGSEFQVNTYTTSDQSGPYANPPVVGLSDGKFVMTWTSESQDGSGDGIYGQMFNANGSKYGSEFQVNTYTASYQNYPSVAGLNDGKFVVTWQSGDQDGDSYGIYGQMFRAYDSSASGYSSSSQQIPRSSTKISSSYDSITSSLETSSSTITSSIEISSHSSEQTISSVVSSSSPVSSIGYTSSSNQTSSSSDAVTQSSSSSTNSVETSGSYNSISSTLETSGSFKSTSNVKSKEPIHSDSIYDEGLSSGEITGIVLGVIATVGLCVAGGFFAVKKMCKSNQDQSVEDVELDPTIPKTFRCSLTGKMMNEPVEIAGERDCFYDREAIEQYFAMEHKSPSGKSLKKLVLIPNYDLRSQIDKYKETLEQPSALQLEV